MPEEDQRLRAMLGASRELRNAARSILTAILLIENEVRSHDDVEGPSQFAFDGVLRQLEILGDLARTLRPLDEVAPQNIRGSDGLAQFAELAFDARRASANSTAEFLVVEEQVAALGVELDPLGEAEVPPPVRPDVARVDSMPRADEIAIEAIQERHKISRTEVLRRALALQSFVDTHLDLGRRLVLHGRKGSRDEVRLPTAGGARG